MGEAKLAPKRSFTPIVSIVGFHHAKGPDIEHWFGGDANPDDPINEDDWPFFPFMALYDGSHSFEQDFSYFTLKREARDDLPAQTLFAISCTRQVDARLLVEKSAEVTRSTVQKAVVVITDSPVYFGHLREQLSMVTKAWFAQLNFDDLDIIKKYHEGLVYQLKGDAFEREAHLGLSLRELVYNFKHNSLVLLKCALLQPKFSLISLIPGLFENLQDASDPELHTYETTVSKPTSMKSSDRKSLLTYMGCPLQIFGKGSLFGPYTPLQQLDVLADKNTTSYIVGSTNSLLLQQKDRYSDIIVNLDDYSLNVTSSSLRSALVLTAADRRWIDALVQTVVESWDEDDPSRPKAMSFTGSEDFIRLQFEEYILALLSSTRYSQYLEKNNGSSGMIGSDETDPMGDFGSDWVHQWKTTDNYRIFEKYTELEIFDVITPRHVCAGGLTFEDVTRRLNQSLSELKLDEKVLAGRIAVARTFASGSKRVSTAFSSIWSELEAAREQRRKAQEEQAKQLAEMEKYNKEIEEHTKARSAISRRSSIMSSRTTSSRSRPTSLFSISTISKDDYLKDPEVTSPITEFGKSAGAYISSWASWANEKKRTFSITSPTLRSTQMNGDVSSIAEDMERPRTAAASSSSNGISSIIEEREEVPDTATRKSDDSVVRVSRARIIPISIPKRESSMINRNIDDLVSPTTKPRDFVDKLVSILPQVRREEPVQRTNSISSQSTLSDTQTNGNATRPMSILELSKTDATTPPPISESESPYASKPATPPPNTRATVSDESETASSVTPRPEPAKRTNSIFARIQKFENGSANKTEDNKTIQGSLKSDQISNGNLQNGSIKRENSLSNGFDEIDFNNSSPTPAKSSDEKNFTQVEPKRDGLSLHKLSNGHAEHKMVAPKAVMAEEIVYHSDEDDDDDEDENEDEDEDEFVEASENDVSRKVADVPDVAEMTDVAL